MAKTNNLTDFLTDVADAIREKEGSSAPINPQDFSAKIRAIQGGGEGGGGESDVVVAPENDVNFRDYDGTILYSYSKDAFLALTEMPELPTQKGLTCQGWNWNIDDAKAYVREYGRLEVGATYITDDGKTRFYIKVEGERKTFSIQFSINKANSLVIDWGDGVSESISSTASASHTYNVVGDYVISFDIAEGATLSFGGSSTSAAILSKPYSNMLKKVELGESVTIKGYAFYTCYSLSSVVLPNSVTSIGSNAFNTCYSLSSVVIPNGVTSIGSNKFYNCSSLSSVVLPNSVTSISDSAFYSCYSLSSVVIPNSVTSIGSSAFYNCRSLSSVVIPNSVTSISGSAFYTCYSLSSVVIPNSVTSIGSSAFYSCYSLSSVVVLNGVTSIGESAFYSCYSLSSVVIPNSVTSINARAFGSCYSIAYIDFRTHTSVPTLSNYTAFSTIASDAKIVVPDALYDEWIAATNWSNSSVTKYIVKASNFNG